MHDHRALGRHSRESLAAADVTTDITILASQAITFPAADAVAGTDDHAVGGGDFDVRAAANSSQSPDAVFPASNDPNLNVTFISATPSVCTIAGVPGPNTATIHPEAVGTCTIVAQSAAIAGVVAGAGCRNGYQHRVGDRAVVPSVWRVGFGYATENRCRTDT